MAWSRGLVKRAPPCVGGISDIYTSASHSPSSLLSSSSMAPCQYCTAYVVAKSTSNLYGCLHRSCRRSSAVLHYTMYGETHEGAVIPGPGSFPCVPFSILIPAFTPDNLLDVRGISFDPSPAGFAPAASPTTL